jgi:hypothetical protein
LSRRFTAATAVLGFAVLGFAWIAVEFLPPALGYEDTDNPAVMVPFIRDYPQVYRVAGVLLILAAFALTVAVVAVSDHLGAQGGRPSLVLRTASVFGLFAAGMMLPLGGLRLATGSTLLLVDKLNEDWSEAAYLAFQMVGTQALAAAAIVSMCAWAVGLSIYGLRSGSLPRWLCALGVIPAMRILVGLLAPFSIDSSAVWIASMVAIPGTTIWFLLLGITLLRLPRVEAHPQEEVTVETT